MHKKLIYNGKSSADMGLVIQAPPAYSVPERDVEKTHVPGRNGDVIIDNGSYKNVEREYSLAKGFIYGPVKTTVLNGQELYEWLTSAKGSYVRLEDDYDPSVYRMATYISNGTITDIFDKALAFTAKFECKPQRFLKSGDIPIEYGEGNATAYINNLTHYESKPEIKIKNVPSGSSAVTLLSVSSENGDDYEEISLLTLKGQNDGVSTLIINSETEECYDEYGNDSSERVSLNGMNFPVLSKGTSKIAISQYDSEFYEVPSYNTVIQNKQQICESYFSTKDNTIASFEEKYIIRPFNTLIKERENSFEASSYFTRLTELCDEGKKIIYGGNSLDVATSYSIQTISDYISNGVTVTFKATTYADFEDEFERYGLSDFLEIKTSGDDSYQIKVKGRGCYRRNSSKDKLIFCYGSTSGYTNVLIDMNGQGSDVTWEIFPDIISIIQSNLPSFIEVEGYTTIEGDYVMLDSIGYKFKLSNYPVGDPESPVPIYWKDKVGLTGLFGKAGWQSCENGQMIVEYKWNTLKNAYVPGGNYLSSNKEYLLRFVYFCKSSKDALQYDFGQNSAKIFEVKLVKLEDVIKVQIYPKNLGYYKISNDIWKDSSIDTSTMIGNIDPASSFRVEYLRDIPKYSNESDWPSWLNSSPVYFKNNSEVTSVVDKLNSDYMKFKVNLSAYYRRYINDDNSEEITEFSYIESGHYLLFDLYDLQVEFDDSITIGRYFSEMLEWEDPDSVPEFPYDRANSIGNGTPVLNPYLPDWLKYEVEMKVKFNSEPNSERTAKPILFENIEEYNSGKTYKKNDLCKRMSGSQMLYYICISETATGNFNPNKWKEFLDSAYCWEVTTADTDIKKFFTHETWYAELNEKIFDEDGNEIGYVVEAPTIYFYSGDNTGGFYKYDNSNAWVYHNAGDTENPIIKIGYRDSVMFYYIDSMPESFEEYYPQGEEPEWLQYFDIERVPGGNSNPLTINFKIKNGKGGYYKTNSQVHWKKYNAGDICLTSLVGETNTIYHLVPNENQSALDKTEIVITPKWWML